MKITGKNKFFTFYQNNPGGNFVSNDKLKEYVIIEAYSPDEANKIAQNIGIYFNGCEDGRDCACCGDRWRPVSEHNGEFFPSIYGKEITENYKDYKDYIVYYKNGTTKITHRS